MGYSELGYNTLLTKAEITDAITNANVDSVITSGAIGFQQTTMNKLLTNQDMQSEDFVTGVSGWQIQGNGNVEFGDGNFRGDITGASGTFTGTLSAATGFIGGWTINATSITDTAGTVGLSSEVTGGDDIRFWAGNVTPASAPFRVTEAGSLVATSAIIAGWTIDSTTISSASNEVVLDSANKKITVGTSAELVIDGDNKNISSSNYISGYAGSGFYLDSDLLEVGNIASRGIIRTAVFQKDVISAVGGNVAILDADVLDTDMTALDASTLSIEENTTFLEGDILRIKDGIDDEWLEVLTSGEAICDSYSEAYWNAWTALFTGGGFQMSGQSFTGDGNVLSSCKFYLQKVTGSPTGNATATIYAHTGTFGTDGIPTGAALATSGTFDVSTLTSTAELVTFTFTGAEKITLVDGTNYFVILEYPGGDTSNRVNQGASLPNVLAPGNAAYFKTADVWTSSEWDRIFYVYTDQSSNPYTVTRDKAGDYTADNNPAWTKGAAVVNYGQSGDGGVYMTASESNAPYLSIFDHAGEPWDTINTRLRLGNLNGYLGYSTDKYGIAIGETDKYLKYDTTNGLRVKGDVTLTGGEVSADYLTAGTITSKAIALAADATDCYIGSGKTDFTNTDTGFILGRDYGDSNTAKFYIGNSSDYLNWTGSTMSMLCSGENAITIDYGSDILLKEGGDLKFTSVVAPTACTATLVATAVGNIDAGTHSYKIVYVNETGETSLGAVSNVVTTDATHKQVDLTDIPVSISGSVISREIYRTKAASPGDVYYLLDEIANNTATTYTDNVADADLTGESANNKENNTYGKIIINNIVVASLATTNILIGQHSGTNLTTGFGNTFLGKQTGRFTDSGSRNTFIGAFSGEYNTTGERNTFIGYGVGANTTGDENTFIGQVAGWYNSSGYGNTFIGNYAGFYETGSNKLFIDNAARASEADGRIKSLIYGGFHATALSQQITFNVGTLNILDGGNIATGTTTGLKIGTATSQKLGFYNATPVDQPATVADATDAASVILRCNDIIDRLQELGLIA